MTDSKKPVDVSLLQRGKFIELTVLTALAGCATGSLSPRAILAGGRTGGLRTRSFSSGGYTVVATNTGGQILDASGKVIMAGDVNQAGAMVYSAGAGQVVFPYPSGGQLLLNAPNDLGNALEFTPISDSAGTLQYTDGSGISGSTSVTQAGSVYTVEYQDTVTPRTVYQYVGGSGGGGGGGCGSHGCPHVPIRGRVGTESFADCVFSELMTTALGAGTAARAYKVLGAANFVLDEIPIIDLISLGADVAVVLVSLAWAIWICSNGNPQ